MSEAWSIKTNRDRNILNLKGGSSSKRAFHDLVEKIQKDYFKKSRTFDFLKNKKFIKQVYNL